LQISAWTLDNELTQLRTFGLLVPAIFLGVAAFILHVALTRALALQRTQIAALKALGYSNGAVAWHYVKWALVIAAAAACAGVAAGVWVGASLIGLYNECFRFPTLTYYLSPGLALLSIAASLLVAAFGAQSAVRRAVRVPPAEARRPMKALASTIGLAFAVAVPFVGLAFLDVMDTLIDQQFTATMRQEATLTFVEPRPGRIAHDVAHLPGVFDIDPARIVPARLRAVTRSRALVITGLESAPRLTRVIDRARGPVELPPEGLLLTRMLGDILGVGAGDIVEVTVLEGRRPVRAMRVAALLDDSIGLQVCSALPALRSR
jgi:putative ABC transport system permease protein